MRSPRLAALELRRFGRGKLPRLGLVALMLIPLLYGALYLCSFWDPYSRLDKIPVALVNNDEGSSADGKKINAGEELAGNVTDSKTFHWEEVSAAEAAKGVEDGTYYLSLTVPKNFSERIASSSGDSPQTGALQVRTNDANNYIVGSISKTVFSEIRAKTSAKSSRAFLDKIFVSFSDLHDRTAEAADGASKLDDGLDDAKKGSGKLADGLGTAKDSTGKLSGGLGKLDKGSGDLSKGAGDTHRGAKTLEEKLGLAHSKIEELSQGTRQVAAGTQKLADTANGLAGKARPFLKSYAKDLGEKARLVAGASGALADDLGTLPRDTAHASSEAREAADQLDTLYDRRCGSAVSLDADCPALKKARDATALAADTAEKVNSLVASHTSGIDKLTGDLRRLDKVATAVADRAPTSERDLETAVAEINRLNAGAHKVSDGAGKIATGAGQLTDGAGRLTDGTGRVADGAGQMHDGIGAAKNGTDQLEGGIGKLKDGAVSLNGGLFKLKDGSNQLAEGLHNGVAKIPDYDKHDRDARTEVMADPVELASKSMHKAPNYGTGLAPYFIPLSLWVGAMVAYMLFAPLSKRALAAGAPGWRIALGSWLPAFAIGVAQVLALMAVLHWGLGLEMARSAATIGFLLLATACFTAVIQLLSAFFGPAGRVLTLVVLMLQLTSAGGTYPVQTSPGFFAAIHPFLPMSYVVDGLRRLITGGGLDPVWQGSIVLAAFTLGALALTALAARSRQVVRMKDLHPELSL
ncbi:YhgE/Pip family protein [Streptomyces sp. NPDC048248]|uniref:YhgE/Pip family protein n=1 Tax=Streptomyces sp. NPDC048248 TaxID=3365523 RepID=UPI003711B8B3